MPPISIMIKPASSTCNMRCKYCFYNDVAKNRETPSHGAMSLQTAETVVKKAFAYADGNPVWFNFQGGEPLLAGKAFFRATLNLISRANIKNSPVFLGIQTNGTLIDDEWCEIFKTGDFLVGRRRNRKRKPRGQGRQPNFSKGRRGGKTSSKTRRKFQYPYRSDKGRRDENRQDLSVFHVARLQTVAVYPLSETSFRRGRKPRFLP